MKKFTASLFFVLIATAVASEASPKPGAYSGTVTFTTSHDTLDIQVKKTVPAKARLLEGGYLGLITPNDRLLAPSAQGTSEVEQFLSFTITGDQIFDSEGNNLTAITTLTPTKIIFYLAHFYNSGTSQANLAHTAVITLRRVGH